MRLQVALDITDIRKAIQLTKDLCKVGLEVVEVGTPLIKTYGLPSVSAVKVACPKAEVVADLKTADVGALEARLAWEFGADWATVMGATNIETIEEFVKEGRGLGLKSIVDLIGVQNPEARAREILEVVRPDMFVVHLGIDVQKRTGLTFENLLDIATIIKGLGVGVGVAGGILEREIELILKRGVNVDVVIVGRAIVNDASPQLRYVNLSKALKEGIHRSL